MFASQVSSPVQLFVVHLSYVLDYEKHWAPLSMALSISLFTSVAQDRLQHVSKFLNSVMFVSLTLTTFLTQGFRNSTLIISRRSLNTSATVMADTPIQRPSCPPMSLIRFSSCKKKNSYESIVPTFWIKSAFEPNGPLGRRFLLFSVA